MDFRFGVSFKLQRLCHVCVIDGVDFIPNHRDDGEREAQPRELGQWPINYTQYHMCSASANLACLPVYQLSY